ncbi:MAG: hypothetical protein EBS21_04355 [Sphingomonadaceae bacterium]|nr:hypothetical protein [Sphingomonadaceae bacterium]
MAISILAPVLLVAAQVASVPAEPDFSGLLSAPENAIRSCKFVRRPDGVHLIITKAKYSEGNAISIEFSDAKSYVAYDYIFSVYGKKPRRFILTNSHLEKMDQIDIPLRTAIGFNENRVDPIFIKNGEYRIYIGYDFRSSDESQIFGACYATLGAKQP